MSSQRATPRNGWIASVVRGTAIFLAAVAAIAAFSRDALAQGRTVAFLVGVSEYDSKDVLPPVKSIPGAVNELAGLMRASGIAADDIVTVTGARHQTTRGVILSQLGSLVDGTHPTVKRLSYRDTLIIAWSGHGVEMMNEPEFTFCPSDADLTRVESRITVPQLLQKIERLDADGNPKILPGSVLLIADACRNDPRNEGLGFGDAFRTFQDRVFPKRRGVVMMFACDRGQRSLIDPVTERSFFFESLIDAWRGGAGIDGRNTVKLSALTSYLSERTQEMAARRKDGAQQSPKLKFPKGDEVALNEWHIPIARTKYVKDEIPFRFRNQRDWQGYTFENIDFSRQSLSGYNLSRCRFVNCRFANAGFVDGTGVSRAVFVDCNLFNTDFSQATGTSRLRFEGRSTVDEGFGNPDRWKDGKPEKVPSSDDNPKS